MRYNNSHTFGSKRILSLSWAVLLLLSAGGALTLSTAAPAQTILDSNRQMTEILNTISNYVINVCPDPTTELKKETTEWGVKGKVELDKLLRKIASLGGEAWYNERIEKSNGLLQEDLPEVIKHAIDCRRALTKLLLKTFFPEGGYVAAPPQSNTNNTPTDPSLNTSGVGARSNAESPRERYTAYVVSGSSNNPELNASRLLQIALEDQGFRVLPAPERAMADIIVEISMAKGDHIDCRPEGHGKCSIEVNAHYQAYWSESRNEILPPETLIEPNTGKPTIATKEAAEGAARRIATMVRQKINS
jgi:hypothetical protein